MAKRFSRKKAKKDEFVSTIEKVYEFAEKHIKKYAKIIFYVIGALILIVIIGFSWNYFRGTKEEGATIILHNALKHFHAPVFETQDNIPPDIKGPIYNSEKIKYETSIEHLQEVIDNYPSTPSSAMAYYYQGLSNAHLNNFDNAKEKLHQALDGPLPKLIVPLARYALARSYEAKNNFEEALKIYKKILKRHSDFIPQDKTLMQIGFCYEQLDQLDKAIEQYRKIVNDFEDSSYKNEAQNKLDAIAPPISQTPPEEK